MPGSRLRRRALKATELPPAVGGNRERIRTAPAPGGAPRPLVRVRAQRPDFTSTTCGPVVAVPSTPSPGCARSQARLKLCGSWTAGPAGGPPTCRSRSPGPARRRRPADAAQQRVPAVGAVAGLDDAGAHLLGGVAGQLVNERCCIGLMSGHAFRKLVAGDGVDQPVVRGQVQAVGLGLRSTDGPQMMPPVRPCRGR